MITHRQIALAIATACTFATPLSAHAVVIDFTGGTVHAFGGASHITNQLDVHEDVLSYEEQGMRVTIDGGGLGIVGDYYNEVAAAGVGNDVLHAHWNNGINSITFTKMDGQAFDLTYFDLTSNTTAGGGQSTGLEDSWITASNGATLKLPSSDWGFAKDFNGATGDGVARLFLGDSFLGITSFTVTSNNASCFGVDNFYIDQSAPPVPEPASLALVTAGLGIVAWRARRQRQGPPGF